MKKVEGFLASDGTFFQTEADAEFHEADKELQELSRVHGTDPSRLLEAVWYLRVSIRRYLDAKDAIADGASGDDFKLGTDPAGFYQQHANGPENKPGPVLDKPPSRG